MNQERKATIRFLCKTQAWAESKEERLWALGELKLTDLITCRNAMQEMKNKTQRELEYLCAVIDTIKWEQEKSIQEENFLCL